MSRTQLIDVIVQALRTEDYATVVDTFDDALAQLEDRPLLLPRLYGWLAQAQLQLRQPAMALRSCSKAIKAAKLIDDQSGVQELKTLRTQIIAVKVALDAVPSNPTDPLSLATVCFNSGDFDTGEEYCLTYYQAAVQQQDHKAMVLAQLALSHHPVHQHSSLACALNIAQECGDQNLISAVKRAFDASEYTPTPHVF